MVVENFHKCKETLEAEMKEKAKQKRLERRMKQQQLADESGGLIEIETERKTDEVTDDLSRPYWNEYGPRRLWVHNIVTSKYFDLAIAAVIGVNVVSMAMV